ncbi:MAG: glycine cleavage system aminomethyltransferase GcvT [bacterium]
MELKKTPFYDRIVEAGGRMVPFAGYHMPIEFTGIVEEHLAVRSRAGIFDVSHMGEISVSGEGAAGYVNRLTTNDVASLDLMQVQYTAMLNDRGGVIDDLLVYRRKFDYLLVVNAVNVERDFDWIEEHAPEGVAVRNLSDETAQLAVQGPEAVEMIAATCDDDVAGLGTFRSMGATIGGVPCLVSRTGYTGEDGLEIYAGTGHAGVLWDTIMKAGRRPAPIGLGARDSLRLEAALRLHGSDMDENTTPLEAGLGWIVKMDKGDFFGREALLAQKAEGLKKRLIGLKSDARRFPRPGYAVWAAGREVGHVASGGFSPSLNCGIALAYVEAGLAKRSTEFQIDVRGNKIDAKYVKGPFYKRPVPE